MDLTNKLAPKMTAPKLTAPKILDRAGAAVFHLKNRKVLVVFFALVAFLGFVAVVLPDANSPVPSAPPARSPVSVTTRQAKAVARTVGLDLLLGTAPSPALLSASLGREIARRPASPPIAEALFLPTTLLVAHEAGQWLYRVTATVGHVRAAVEILVEAAPHPIVVGVAGLAS